MSYIEREYTSVYDYIAEHIAVSTSVAERSGWEDLVDLDDDSVVALDDDWSWGRSSTPSRTNEEEGERMDDTGDEVVAQVGHDEANQVTNDTVVSFNDDRSKTIPLRSLEVVGDESEGEEDGNGDSGSSCGGGDDVFDEDKRNVDLFDEENELENEGEVYVEEGDNLSVRSSSSSAESDEDDDNERYRRRYNRYQDRMALAAQRRLWMGQRDIVSDTSPNSSSSGRRKARFPGFIRVVPRDTRSGGGSKHVIRVWDTRRDMTSNERMYRKCMEYVKYTNKRVKRAQVFDAVKHQRMSSMSEYFTDMYPFAAKLDALCAFRRFNRERKMASLRAAKESGDRLLKAMRAYERKLRRVELYSTRERNAFREIDRVFDRGLRRKIRCNRRRNRRVSTTPPTTAVANDNPVVGDGDAVGEIDALNRFANTFERCHICLSYKRMCNFVFSLSCSHRACSDCTFANMMAPFVDEIRAMTSRDNYLLRRVVRDMLMTPCMMCRKPIPEYIRMVRNGELYSYKLLTQADMMYELVESLPLSLRRDERMMFNVINVY